MQGCSVSPHLHTTVSSQVRYKTSVPRTLKIIKALCLLQVVRTPDWLRNMGRYEALSVIAVWPQAEYLFFTFPNARMLSVFAVGPGTGNLPMNVVFDQHPQISRQHLEAPKALSNPAHWSAFESMALPRSKPVESNTPSMSQNVR